MAENNERKPINPSTLKYITFEGGGGKGIVYSGAIDVLQEKGVLPLTTGQIKGISGASAGAITSLFVSLGMSKDDISKQVNEKAFEKFYDDPNPGVYKAIKVKSGKIEAGYITDKYTIEETISETPSMPDMSGGMWSNYYGTGFPTSQTEPEVLTEITEIEVGNADHFYMEKNRGIAAGRTNYKTYSTHYPLGAIKLAARLFGVKRKAKKAKKQKQDPLMGKFAKFENVKEYLFSILMDRGLFTGFANREYFQKMAFVYLYEYYNTKPAFAHLSHAFKTANGGQEYDKTRQDSYNYTFISNTLSFQLLFDITEADLYVTSSNITQNKSFLFSVKHTPDFPVVEAISCSMNIPFVFKPIYINYISPDGVNYNGLYVDGGLLNNLPMHVWDDPGFASPLNSGVIAIRVSDGYDPTDDRYKNHEEWKKHFQFLCDTELTTKEAQADYLKKIDIKTNLGNSHSFTYKLVNKGVLSHVLKMVGDLYGTVFYPAEEGQIRTESERDQTIELFSYDVGILDFAPQENIKNFIVERAKEKTKSRLTS